MVTDLSICLCWFFAIFFSIRFEKSTRESCKCACFFPKIHASGKELGNEILQPLSLVDNDGSDDGAAWRGKGRWQKYSFCCAIVCPSATMCWWL